MKLISEQYDGIVIDTKLGERVAVQLPESPTTGFSWDSCDWYFPDNVDVLLNEFRPLNPMKIGSDGYRRWVVKPLEEGQYQFVFSYQQSWEQSPVKTFTFTLVVKKPKPKKEEDDD